jgi:hypothetical protein
MESPIETLDDRVLASLAPEELGTCWEALQSCQSAHLFGSVARGRGGYGSDVDLLLVGNGLSRKLRGVDLIWVTPQRVSQQAWLGSELAQHVACFGVHLLGHDDWTRHVIRSRQAVTKKADRVAARASSLSKMHLSMTRALKEKNVRLLLRDLFRLELLSRGDAVITTPEIDDSLEGPQREQATHELLVSLSRKTLVDRQTLAEVRECVLSLGGRIVV